MAVQPPCHGMLDQDGSAKMVWKSDPRSPAGGHWGRARKRPTTEAGRKAAAAARAAAAQALQQRRERPTTEAGRAAAVAARAAAAQALQQQGGKRPTMEAGRAEYSAAQAAAAQALRSAVEGPLDALVEGSPLKKPRKLSRRDKELEDLAAFNAWNTQTIAAC